MRILRVNILRADTCGGLLDGFSETFHAVQSTRPTSFEPLCLIGPNGSGKSQFLQILAEIFQAILAHCVPSEERLDGNPDLLFEIEYLIWPSGEDSPVRVFASRTDNLGSLRWVLRHRLEGTENWIDCDPTSTATQPLLPWRIVGYTSGNNETLSLPFLQSRSAYAKEVTERALSRETSRNAVPETRLMLIDYGTHLEVLVANLVLGSPELRKALLEDARVRDLHSFRCIIQLNHSAAPKVEIAKTAGARKGVQLTEELEFYIERLRQCSTCFDHNPKTETYTFDFWLNDATRAAFAHHWPDGVFALYSSLHKLAMLNDLALPNRVRKRLRSPQRIRRFASRLPEPHDEDKVFRFERVNFTTAKDSRVDYVSLSDGEHQLIQILGTVAMLAHANVLLLLDEPESHFNPKWRVQFLSRLNDLPNSANHNGGARDGLRMQDLMLTTHAPFVPSDMPRERVLIFRKEDGDVKIRRPQLETFGSTFDSILEECFGVSPPISQISRDRIDALLESKDPQEVREGLDQLGHSVEKSYLADHLRSLLRSDGD